MAFLP